MAKYIYKSSKSDDLNKFKKNSRTKYKYYKTAKKYGDKESIEDYRIYYCNRNSSNF